MANRNLETAAVREWCMQLLSCECTAATIPCPYFGWFSKTPIHCVAWNLAPEGSMDPWRRNTLRIHTFEPTQHKQIKTRSKLSVDKFKYSNTSTLLTPTLQQFSLQYFNTRTTFEMFKWEELERWKVEVWIVVVFTSASYWRLDFLQCMNKTETKLQRASCRLQLATTLTASQAPKTNSKTSIRARVVGVYLASPWVCPRAAPSMTPHPRSRSRSWTSTLQEK